MSKQHSMTRSKVKTMNTTPVKIQPVVDAVQMHTGKSWERLCSRSRSQRLSLIRKMAAAVCREIFPEMSYREIGEVLGGRDHSTVIYWMRSIKEIVAEDIMYRTVLLSIFNEARQRKERYDAQHHVAVS